jgi:hypothetical protein
MTSPSPASDVEFEVAFSFLDHDHALAIQLADLLRDRMRVFVYSEQQKDLAGRDGLEEFSTIFRRKSALCVVLYREGWGQTRWTRVEETALKSRGFERGWQFLLVVVLDNSPLPDWLPPTKIWFGLDQYGVQAAAAVIDARVQEAGGTVHQESAREKATRLAHEAQRNEERELFLRSVNGVQAAKRELDNLFDHLEREAAAINQLGGTKMDLVRRDAFVVALRTPLSSITFGWAQQFGNSLEGSYLVIRELDGTYFFGRNEAENAERNSVHAKFDVAATGELGWRKHDEPERFYSTAQLAEHYLKRILESPDRAESSREDFYST